MKKIAFALLLSCLGVVYGFAQEFHFIPKVGLNLSTITGLYDMGVRPGLNVGLSGEFLLTSRFAFEPGVYYSMQGAKGDIVIADESGQSQDGTVICGADCLNIPIYAKWYSNAGGLYLFGGPQISIKVHETNKVKASGRDDVDPFEGASTLKTFDLGLGVGLGYQFDSGLLASAGYTIGFLNPFKDSYGKTYLNSVFQFNLGWRF